MVGWLLLWNAAALLLYMSIAFAVSYKRGRLDTVDSAYGGAFVVVAWLVAGLELEFRTVLIAILIDVWAIRLTNHIVQRSAKSNKDDQRYTDIAAKWGERRKWPRAYLSIFIVQCLAVLLISLPTVFASGESVRYAMLITVIGTVIWAKGFVIEMIGDYQLKKFISDKANKGKVLETGLWKYTRHPNYLGEITQWYGIGIIACSAAWGWIGLLGPLFLTVLIRYVSGVPPIENRKRQDPAYKAYMDRTNAIFPKLTRLTK